MSKGVYFSVTLHGHVYPSLPLIGELVRRGHHIIYFAGSVHEEIVGATGAEFRAYPSVVDAHALGQRPRVGDYLAYTMVRGVHAMLGRPLAQLREDPPDFVMHDCVAPWGRVLTQALSVPGVSFAPLLVHNTLTKDWMKEVPPPPATAEDSKRKKGRHFTLRTMKLLGQMKNAMKREGLTPVPMTDYARAYEDLNIVSTSRQFQPMGETFDDSYVFAGPMLNFADNSAVPVKNNNQRLAYCSLGTTNISRDLSLYSACLDALGRFPGRVIMSMSGSLDRNTLGRVPDNVQLESFIPEAEEFKLLGRANVVITHAGFGTLQKCLYQGTPMAMIPLNFEHARNAWRAQELGIGIRFDREKVTGAELVSALERLVEEPSFRDNAAAMARTLRAAGGVTTAADAIESYISRGNGSSDGRVTARV